MFRLQFLYLLHFFSYLTCWRYAAFFVRGNVYCSLYGWMAPYSETNCPFILALHIEKGFWFEIH